MGRISDIVSPFPYLGPRRRFVLTFRSSVGSSSHGLFCSDASDLLKLSWNAFLSLMNQAFPVVSLA